MNPFIEKYKTIDRVAYFKYMAALKKIYHRLNNANLNVYEIDLHHLEKYFFDYGIIKLVDSKEIIDYHYFVYSFLFETKEATIKNFLKYKETATDDNKALSINKLLIIQNK